MQVKTEGCVGFVLGDCQCVTVGAALWEGLRVYERALALGLFRRKVRSDPFSVRVSASDRPGAPACPSVPGPALQAQLLRRVKDTERVGLAHTQWEETAQPQGRWPGRASLGVAGIACVGHRACPVARGTTAHSAAHRAWDAVVPSPQTTRTPSTDWCLEPSLCRSVIFPCLQPSPLLHHTQCAPQLPQHSTGLKGKLVCRVPHKQVPYHRVKPAPPGLPVGMARLSSSRWDTTPPWASSGVSGLLTMSPDWSGSV